MVETHFSVVGASLPPNRFSEKDIQPQRMVEICNDFLSRFREATESGNPEAFDNLFVEGGYWRDILSFTNDFRSFTKVNIFQAAKDRLALSSAYGGEIEFQPKLNTLDNHANIEFGFKFSTNLGPCVATARLVKTGENEIGAFVLYTALDGIHGVTEQIRHNRISGDKNSMDHYDLIRERELEDPNPSVIIVGAGQCGLSVAARLKYMGVRALVIDKFDRVGDNWRKRYGSLALHDTLYSQALPYMSWPETFPEFISSGKFANWLEHYVEALELNVWVKSQVVPGKSYFDETEQKWHMKVDRDGREYNFVVDNVVIATGLCNKPKMPEPFPGQEKFMPEIIHSSVHKGGAAWRGKNVLVIGTGSSGNDISLDLSNHGAIPTLLQRSPTYIQSIENGIVKTLNGDLMVEGVNLDYADRVGEAMPACVKKAVLQRLVPKIAELDKCLLDGLDAKGFKTYLGPDDSGSLFLSMERGGGFYFDSGAGEKIIEGKIKVKNGEIARFTENSVVFKDGSNLNPDLVIFCTGFTGFKESVIETLGEKAGNQLTKIWGLDCEGEINGLYRDCGVPNTYFMSGALAISRPYSKHLALQIVAQKHGKLGPRYSIAESRRTGNYVDVSGLLYQ